MKDLDSDELSDNKNLIRTWLRETVLPLAENVADRTESDGGAQAHMPALMKDLRWAVTQEMVGEDMLKEFEEDIQFDFKDMAVAERVFQTNIKDLALMSHIVRTVDAITDADGFYPSASANCNLDDFVEAKQKALLKWTENTLLKFCVTNLQVDSSDDEGEGEDDSDEEEEDEDDEANGIEKDSDDDDDDDDDEGSESGEPDSDTEAKMLAEADASEGEDIGAEAVPAAKRIKTE
jgi:hypothetical protein